MREDFEKLPPASEEEEDLLDLAAHAPRTSRLACQIILTEDMKSLTSASRPARPTGWAASSPGGSGLPTRLSLASRLSARFAAASRRASRAKLQLLQGEPARVRAVEELERCDARPA